MDPWALNRTSRLPPRTAIDREVTTDVQISTTICLKLYGSDDIVESPRFVETANEIRPG